MISETLFILFITIIISSIIHYKYDRNNGDNSGTISAVIITTVVITVLSFAGACFNKEYVVVERYILTETNGYDLNNDSIIFIDGYNDTRVLYLAANGINIKYLEDGESYIEIAHTYSNENTLIGMITISLNRINETKTVYVNTSKIKPVDK